MRDSNRSIAYFSMEMGLDSGMLTYSGGLGVLAGDSLRAAADRGIPMVGVTLVHRKGYFCQRLDAQGYQYEEPCEWQPEELLEARSPMVTLRIEGRSVSVRAWQYTITGTAGHTVPVYFLDTRLPENDGWDQSLTDNLYGGDMRYRLCQEVLLGLGGLAVLETLGHRRIRTFHMNEGHSSLLALGLLAESLAARGLTEPSANDLEAVRERCVFTTHTPVPAGHDKYPRELVLSVLGEQRSALLEATGCFVDGQLNMTYLGLFFSRYINGVSMRHEQISRGMFPGYPFNSITNGVHAFTWVSPPFQDLFDQHIPEWRQDNLYLRYAVGIPEQEIWAAHMRAKHDLMMEIERRSGAALDANILTIGFARRATQYKRADLLFTDVERLRQIARPAGGLQIVYAGKAHPRDEGGKTLIRRIFEAAEALRSDIPVIYLADYDLALARYLCAGADLWLNTPERPQEASGTSGMKAALNGVPSFSVLDGWWLEGHQEGVTGWSIGGPTGESNAITESSDLYGKLESVILPLFCGDRNAYARVMRSTIALNGSFFNAQRMIDQYETNAYVRFRDDLGE